MRFYMSVNPDFFAGTRVEAEAARVVSEAAEAPAAPAADGAAARA